MLDFGRIAKARKEVKELYKLGVISMNPYQNKVHLTTEVFLKKFDVFEGYIRNSEEYGLELYVYIDDTYYFTVCSIEEVKNEKV